MLSIITPVHNEEKIIESFVKNAVGFLRKKKINGEVLVVENGSTDKTLEILRKLKFNELKIISLPVGNKGLALKKGIEMAKGEYLITLDTDLWDEEFVKKSIENLDNYDVVVGSKVITGAKDHRSFPMRFINWGYNFVMRLFFDFQGTETHAKLSFRKKSIMSLVKKCKTSELVWDTELILRAERAGLSKLEIPTEVSEIRPRRFGGIDQMIKTIKNCFILLFAIGPKFNWAYILVFGAILLGAFLRFYNYYQWFFFSVDEEHYSFMTRMITVDRHFPLIGGPISGTKLYMAPWFLYFNAIWFWLSNNNPVFSGAVFTALELGAVIIIYLLGKKLFSAKAGAIGALLYAGSFLMALFDRHYWNITLTPLILILT
ncbi:glycosyltransferase, partial [Candidatus Gottesmanbacteria bacterium]|nr:glycosyltransferase [Candidatus Gottesmanbacteria bacterium]